MIGYRLRTVALLLIAAAVVSAPLRSDAQPATPRAAASPAAADAELLQHGGQIFDTVCIACHQPGGVGIEGVYPALAGNPIVTEQDPRFVVQTVLYGSGGMPRFEDVYTDQEVASVVSYVRGAWGNHASAVTPGFVHEVRLAVEEAVAETPTGTVAERPGDVLAATPVP